MTKELDLIVKSNKLVEASYKLSQAEFNLLNIVFTQLNDGKEGNTGNWMFADFKVTASEYSQIYNVDISTAYEDLQRASQNLFQRYFKYENGLDKNPKYVEIVESRWVSKIKYSKQGGYVTVVLTDDVLDMVGMLKERFTQYYLQHTVGFTSIYAKRLYEMIVRWRGMGKKSPKISVIDLRYQLGIDDNQYTLMADFKKRVLDTAMQQINDHSNITASYEQIKKGRSIIAFTFAFKDKKVIEGKSKNITSPPSRDPQTIDFIDDLTDSELKIITAKADDHINKHGITDPKHKANIHQKAKSEKWGIGDISHDLPPAKSVDMPDLTPTDQQIKEQMRQQLLAKKG